jgi:hypothetical protein
MISQDVIPPVFKGSRIAGREDGCGAASPVPSRL